MKQTKKDIELHWRAYCSHCWLLSNQPDQVCSNWNFWDKVRLKHSWFYDRNHNEK